MKKFMLSLLILAGAFTAVLAFDACSADDEAEELQHSPQAQLLLQKSREFAKKYGVNMTLNEDNIEETAKTLSVEEMEKDFREWAKLTKTPLVVKNSDNGKLTKNNIKLRRKTVEMELSGRRGEFKGSGSFGEMGRYYNAEVTVNWLYHSSFKHPVVADVEVLSGDDCIGNRTTVALSSEFDTASGKISFSASGVFSFKDMKYTKSVSLNVYFNEATQVKSISMS